MAERSDFQAVFRSLVAADPNSLGRVLDVGCGAQLNPAVRELYDRAAVVHGVDPTPEVMANNALDPAGRWQGTMESAAVPEHSYDLAIAYNVVEHVSHPAAFLEAVFRVLKPGGTAWILTPNGSHPFAMLSRSLELAGLKPFFARHNPGVNDYPAYYRLNRLGAIRRHAAAAGFRSARVVYVPCMQWDSYFPYWLRWVPRLYDRMIGLRLARAMQVLIVGLSKPADGSSATPWPGGGP